MAKQLRKEEAIYIAPQIKGYINKDGNPIVFDELKKKQLYNRDDIIDDKISIYERQVEEWFLNRAKHLLKKDNYWFIILMISISYIEWVEQYIQWKSSNGQSKVFFTIGLKRIFDLEDICEDKIKKFYNQVRCWLFHSGMTKNWVIINENFSKAIDFSDLDSIKINQKIFLETIIKDFKKYIKKLKDSKNKTQREMFDKLYKNY